MLTVKDINVFYDKVHVLLGVSFDVKKGELVTVIGANGAGKSTMLKTLSGLLAPRSGEIVFDGQSIAGLPPNVIVEKGIIHVPEGRRVFPQMTVRENLRMGAYTRSWRTSFDQDYKLIFDIFPVLKERFRQLAGTLSGGEQQMLAMARALMGRPKLLLLDEPSMGLAPKLVETVFEKIVSINTQGIPIVLVEQNAYMALQIASRAFVIETGKVVLSGMSRELKNNPHIEGAYLGGSIE